MHHYILLCGGQVWDRSKECWTDYTLTVSGNVSVTQQCVFPSRESIRRAFAARPQPAELRGVTLGEDAEIIKIKMVVEATWRPMGRNSVFLSR